MESFWKTMCFGYTAAVWYSYIIKEKRLLYLSGYTKYLTVYVVTKSDHYRANLHLLCNGSTLWDPGILKDFKRHSFLKDQKQNI